MVRDPTGSTLRILIPDLDFPQRQALPVCILFQHRYNAALFSSAGPAHIRSGGFIPGNLLRLLGYYWGVIGVIGIIASAVFKLVPRIVELGNYSFAVQHWLLLLVFTPYMAYAEGYKGFYLNLAPRVQARALYLRDAGGPLLALTAPFFCMGYFYATRRRMLTSWIVSLSIVLLVAIVSRVPQPWRGLIDVGVVVGLVVGIAALVWYWLRFEFAGIRPATAPDLP